MSLEYMLDTNIVVEVLRGRADGLLERLDRHRSHLCVSAITAMELDYGVGRSSHPQDMRHDVDGLLALLEVAPFDRNAARHAGDIRTVLAHRGVMMEPFDTLIAGHGRSLGLTVVTHDEAFRRVPDLIVEDWLD